MCDELCEQDLESLPLPKDWTDNGRYAVLKVICIVGKAETARRFFVSDDTVRTWLRRADDDSRLLDQLGSQCNLAALARMLVAVDSQRHSAADHCTGGTIAVRAGG